MIAAAVVLCAKLRSGDVALAAGLRQCVVSVV
jgi:hypothetical protein